MKVHKNNINYFLKNKKKIIIIKLKLKVFYKKLMKLLVILKLIRL